MTSTPMAPPPLLAPASALSLLAASSTPWLFGIRHHSPACAWAVPLFLDGMNPDRVLVEIPADLSPWLPWLTSPEAQLPLALAAAFPDGRLSFHPFADFSPEMAALRWARDRGVPVEAFDLPLSMGEEQESPPFSPDSSPHPFKGGVLHPDEESSSWEIQVEARVGTDPEALRRASLLYGWGVRVASGPPSPRDLHREAWMRQQIARAREEGAKRIAVVIGAFHGPSLVEEPGVDPWPRWNPPPIAEVQTPVTSLVPYGFEQFDSRSGYPSGIRHPLWCQRIWEARSHRRDLSTVAARTLVEVCRHLRSLGHSAGTPEARESLRMAFDLARLRNLPQPSHRELLEGMGAALGQSESLGRGRVLEQAQDAVMMGRMRGSLAPGTPRSGLLPGVELLLARLRLPGPESQGKEPLLLRLDPLRSPLDRLRQVTLERLQICGVPYAEATPSQIPLGEPLTRAWEVSWTASTAASLSLAGIWGVTLAMAARGSLQREESRLREASAWNPSSRLEDLDASARCGLGDRVASGLTEFMESLRLQASLGELVAVVSLGDSILSGHIPGMIPSGDLLQHIDKTKEIIDFSPPPAWHREVLISTALATCRGLLGSTDEADVLSLAELVRIQRRGEGEGGDGDGSLRHTLAEMVGSGSPLMQGGAAGCQILLGVRDVEALGIWLGSAVDGATTPSGRSSLTARLRGSLLAAGGVMEGNSSVLDAMETRIAALSDADFLSRLPSLRLGFDVLSPAARERLLQSRQLSGTPLTQDPLLLGRQGQADAHARMMLISLGLFPPPPLSAAPPGPPLPAGSPPPHPLAIGASLDSGTRWRLILGSGPLPEGSTAFIASQLLTRFLGPGQGEGSQGTLLPQGGSGPSHPAPREWASQVEECFGVEVREEILGEAALRGVVSVLDVDPQSVTPSLELLQAVLSLKGGLPEAHLGRLRLLVARCVDALTRALASKVRPALAGLSLPRPNRRRRGPLHLGRTIRANLRTVRFSGEDGSPQLIPERPVFLPPSRPSLDWHLFLLVDVSGSMEESTLHAALLASILASLPSLTVRFLAFSTAVIDLSHHVSDPLSLLMEVSVGGGTAIGRALRHARQEITIPSRTLLVLITDFQEGGSPHLMVEETRALVEAGVRPLGLASLSNRGVPRYHPGLASQMVAAGMDVAALTPLQMARWVAERMA